MSVPVGTASQSAQPIAPTIPSSAPSVLSLPGLVSQPGHVRSFALGDYQNVAGVFHYNLGTWTALLESIGQYSSILLEKVELQITPTNIDGDYASVASIAIVSDSASVPGLHDIAGVNARYGHASHTVSSYFPQEHVCSPLMPPTSSPWIFNMLIGGSTPTLNLVIGYSCLGATSFSLTLHIHYTTAGPSSRILSVTTPAGTATITPQSTRDQTYLALLTQLVSNLSPPALPSAPASSPPSQSTPSSASRSFRA
jgi:hypothetical protein